MKEKDNIYQIIFAIIGLLAITKWILTGNPFLN